MVQESLPQRVNARESAHWYLLGGAATGKVVSAPIDGVVPTCKYIPGT